MPTIETTYILRHPQRLEDARTHPLRGGRFLHRRRRPGHLEQGPGSLRPNSKDARRKSLGTPRQPRIRVPNRRHVRPIRPAQFPPAALSRWEATTSPGSVTPARPPSIPLASTPSRKSPNASRPFADLHPLVLICHAPPYGTALDQIRPGLHAGSTAVREFIAALPACLFFLRPHPRSRRRLHRNRPDPRPQRRKAGLFVRIGMNPHDLRRIRPPIPTPPRPGPGRAEVSLTPPLRKRN